MFDIPPCVEYAPDYGDIEVPPDLAREGVARIIAWTCLDPACPVPRDDGGPVSRPGMHYVMFHEGPASPSRAETLGMVGQVHREVIRTMRRRPTRRQRRARK